MKKKSLILSALALGFSLFGFRADAMENFIIDGNDGKKIFDVQYYGVSDRTDNLENFFLAGDEGFRALNYDLQKDIKLGLNNAFKLWAEILSPGINISHPVQYFVGTYDKENADASSVSLIDGNDVRNPNLFREMLQNGRNLKTVSDLTNDAQLDGLNKGEVAFGFIRIGEDLGINEGDGKFGWVNNSYYVHPVAQSMRNIEITPIMFHEIGHSLGFLTGRDENPLGLTIFDDDGVEHKLLVFTDDADNPDSFTAHLRDQFGKKSAGGMWILPQSLFESENFRKVYIENSGGETLRPEKVFVVEDSKQDYEVKRNGKVYLYFEGENVTDALDGKTFTRGDGQQISGVPINLWENWQPEFSHSDLARSMMSHHNYRSYNSFMEAELAIMQDIGYKIDRKNFYGKSIYRDNVNFVNRQNFTARQDGQYIDGYNYSTLGVGLHVYGSNNTVVQRANILTKGYAGVGIRIDGLRDKITLDKDFEIHADGEYGMGILVAYGKNHEINVDGVVTADGSHGDALHFEFGANSMGANTEYRGSFIRYVRQLSDGQPAIVRNIGLNEIITGDEDFSFTDLNGGDLNGAMVDNVNITGKLSADANNEGRAIYIAEESFVRNININPGAEIDGHIASAWKKFNAEAYGIFDKETKLTYREEVLDKDGNPVYDSKGNKKKKQNNAVAEPLVIQYDGKNYLYHAYIPDLVTNLNFNADMKFSKEIFGDDNMKLNVNGGNLNLTGSEINVVGVKVANGAKVTDGKFTVNNMTEKIAEGFTDEDTGKFFNHGTIFAESEDLTINGDLISDGTLQVQSGKKIIVNGTANLTNATIEIIGAEKNIPVKVLTAEKIFGDNIKLPAGSRIEIAGNDLVLTLE